MKKKIKQLSLNKQTITNLEQDTLSVVIGGRRTNGNRKTCVTCYVTCNDCFTWGASACCTVACG